jgi:hypothetical protein
MVAIQQVANHHAKAQFYATSTIATIKNVGDTFHKKIQMGWCAHPLGYRGVNLIFIIKAQQAIRHLTMARS